MIVSCIDSAGFKCSTPPVGKSGVALGPRAFQLVVLFRQILGTMVDCALMINEELLVRGGHLAMGGDGSGDGGLHCGLDFNRYGPRLVGFYVAYDSVNISDSGIPRILALPQSYRGEDAVWRGRLVSAHAQRCGSLS